MQARDNGSRNGMRRSCSDGRREVPDWAGRARKWQIFREGGMGGWQILIGGGRAGER
jgi:hypothetical protein